MTVAKQKRTPEGRAVVKVYDGDRVAAMIVGPMTLEEASDWEEILLLGLPALRTLKSGNQ